MQDTRLIRPAEGRLVLDPERNDQPLVERAVDWNSHWQRRLDDGDIELVAEAETRAARKKGGDA